MSTILGAQLPKDEFLFGLRHFGKLPSMRFARLFPMDRDPDSGQPMHVRLDGAAALIYDGAPWLFGKPTGESLAWLDGDLLAPVTPSKVVCVGRNYAAHAKELGHEVPKEPLLFFKPPSAIIGPFGTVELPKESERVEYESEIAVVMGKVVRRVDRQEALSSIFGVTAAVDVTARDLQRRDVQFTRGKGFDTFCPIGPEIRTDLDLCALRVRGFRNGELAQDGDVADMLWDIPTLVSYISQVMTLMPGDVILTGTPEGVGPLVHGDRFSVEICNRDKSQLSPPLLLDVQCATE